MTVIKRITANIVLLALLGACGDTPGQRALSGGAIGAGVGTVGSVIVGGDPLTGALIGGGVGAVTGAVTNRRQIDLGHF